VSYPGASSIATFKSDDVLYALRMSSNQVFYAQKMEELKQARERERPLHQQLAELLELVRQLEAEWRSRSRS
jgi:hypothetical protein